VVHENFRFQPWYKAIKTELNEGSLGTVLQATYRLRPGDGQGRDAYLERQPYFRDMENFLIHETGVHFIDVFRYLFGEPQALSADLRRLNPVIAGEDAGHFNFYYDNGLCAQFDGNRLAQKVVWHYMAMVICSDAYKVTPNGKKLPVHLTTMILAATVCTSHKNI